MENSKRLELHSIEDILSSFEKTKPLTKYLREKLCRVMIDIIVVVDIMQRLVDQEVASEMIFVNDNGNGLYTQNPEYEKNYLEIACNGQGDSWLMKLSDGLIYFFDHGTEEIDPMHIDFYQFLQLADLIRQYEEIDDSISKDEIKHLKYLMAQLNKNLPSNYPFEL